MFCSFLMPKIRRNNPPSIFGLLTTTTFIEKPPQQFLQRTMPLTISAKDKTTTRNFSGKIKAKISPAPSMANKSPGFMPLDLFISTPPFSLLIHYMRCRKKCSKDFYASFSVIKISAVPCSTKICAVSAVISLLTPKPQKGLNSKCSNG